MSNLIDHAMREFEIAGWVKRYDTVDEWDDEMQKAICENVVQLLAVFDSQGHSGSSAPYLINMFKKLAMFEIITPLTGEDSEWSEVGRDVLQNKRDGRVFKDIGENPRFDGKPYFIEGKVFIETNVDENGEEYKSSYTSRDSCVVIEFPYIPKTEYVSID